MSSSTMTETAKGIPDKVSFRSQDLRKVKEMAKDLRSRSGLAQEESQSSSSSSEEPDMRGPEWFAEQVGHMDVAIEAAREVLEMAREAVKSARKDLDAKENAAYIFRRQWRQGDLPLFADDEAGDPDDEEEDEDWEGEK